MSQYGSVGVTQSLLSPESRDRLEAQDGAPGATATGTGATGDSSKTTAATSTPSDKSAKSKRASTTSITICGTIGDGTADTYDHQKRSDFDTYSNGLLTGNKQISQGRHCHDRDEKVSIVDKKARCKLITACVLCLIFMIAEIVGGVLANSLAIATDAAHLLTDFASFLISLFAIYIASRPATKSMSFGWHRAEVMGALLSVLLIWIVTGVLVYMAAERVRTGDYEINSTIMLTISSIGIGFNLIMLFTLHDSHGHSHGGHGHSHSHGSSSSTHGSLDGSSTAAVDANAEVTFSGSSPEEVKLLASSEDLEKAGGARSGSNINVRAAFIHVLGDLLQSVGVLVASLVIYFKPEYKLADPLCTFVFSLLVLVTTISILRDTLNVLMEGTPHGLSFSEVRNSLAQIPGVLELHNLRLWSLTTSRIAVCVHLALAKDADHNEVSQRAGSLLRDRFGIHECTVQTEPFVDEMKDCWQCQEPKD